MTYLCQALLLALFVAITGHANAAIPSIELGQISPKGLSPAQAKRVLAFTLKQKRYRLDKPGVFFDGPHTADDGDPLIPGYAIFGLGHDDRRDLAVSSWGLFAVSITSGEVWEINRCEMLSDPAAKRLQSRIRTATGISAADERVQRDGTGCSEKA